MVPVGVMRQAAVSLICVLGAALIASAADGRSGGTSATSWVGTIGFVHPFSAVVAARRANARLLVSAARVEASFEGYTGADHDSSSARTSCSISYRLLERRGAWVYYHQVGVARYPGGQYVQDAPCETTNYGALRTVQAGGKLKAEFGSWSPDARLMDSPPEWRAYLHRD